MTTPSSCAARRASSSFKVFCGPRADCTIRRREALRLPHVHDPPENSFRKVFCHLHCHQSAYPFGIEETQESERRLETKAGVLKMRTTPIRLRVSHRSSSMESCRKSQSLTRFELWGERKHSYVPHCFEAPAEVTATTGKCI